MTHNARRRLYIAIAAASVSLFLGPLFADRALAQAGYWSCSAPSARCIPATLTANLQLTNLHSAVTQAIVSCRLTTPKWSLTRTSAPVTIVNRSFTGSATVTLLTPAEALAQPADRSGTVSCEVQLGNGTTTKTAVASATQPVGVLDYNWEIVSDTSTVNWSQAVTFPDANATP